MVQIDGTDYVPVLSDVNLKSPKGTIIKCLMYSDSGSKITMISRAFFQNTLRHLGCQTEKGKTHLLKGIDPSGDGIISGDHVSLQFLFPNQWELEWKAVVVDKLPEPIILGVRWSQAVGLSVNYGKTKEECRCIIKKGNINQTFLSESEYENRLRAQQAKAFDEIKSAVTQERAYLTKQIFEEKIFPQRPASGEGQEKGQKCQFPIQPKQKRRRMTTY